ncbi:MAG: DUF4112 domain-containing protein [Candidatus Binatia bacterium]
MAHGPERLATAASDESRLHRLDKLARLLDTAIPIPGTRFRIGLDGLLGFIPGVGDTLGAVFSSYIIFEAARLGFPKRTLLRMVGNVTVETLVGAVPILGDIFDIAWKANVRNLALLRAHRAEVARSEERSPRQIMSLSIVVIVLTIIGLLALSIFVLRLLYQAITA